MKSYSILLCLCLPALVLAAHDGVPRLSPNYGEDVEVWWQNHPFNPEGPNYDMVINSPTAQVITLNPGESIQNAVNGLDPAAGGTIYLNPGNYDGGFDVKERDNVHIIGLGTPANPAKLIYAAYGSPEIMLMTCEVMRNYSSMDDALDRTTNPNHALAWQCLRNPRHNFYFKNITFDGQNGAASCVEIKRVQDVVFHDCIFQNFVNGVLVNPSFTHPGMINGHMGLDNIWFVNCDMLGTEKFSSYLDGCHASGYINCHFAGSGKLESGPLYLTNDDFSEDYDGDGHLDDNEKRIANYIAIYGCTYDGPKVDCLAMTGAHALVKNCTVNGAGITHLAAIGTRWISNGTDYGDDTYFHLGHKVLNNTINTNVYTSLLDLNNGQQAAPAEGCRPAFMGRYHVRGNTVTGPCPTLANEIQPQVVGPNVVGGNRVNGVGTADLTIGGTLDTTPPTAPANLQITQATDTTLTLTWTAASDNVAVVGYDIFRNGTFFDFVPGTGTTYTCRYLVPGKTYIFEVRAYDAAYNPGPRGISASRSCTNYNLLLNPSLNDDIRAPYGYPDVWPVISGYSEGDAVTARNGLALKLSPRSTYMAQNRALQPNTQYFMKAWIKTSGVSGNNGIHLRYAELPGSVFNGAWKSGTNDWQEVSNSFTSSANHTNGRLDIQWDFTAGTAWVDDLYLGTGQGPDTQAPAVPGNLRLTGKTDHTMNLAWNAAADNVGTTGYKIYRNGVQVGSTAGLTYNDSCLLGGTTYSYTVTAYDAEMNESSPSSPLAVATAPAGDTNGDTLVDDTDLIVLAQGWLINGSCLVGDLTGNGVIDLEDMAKFSVNWTGPDAVAPTTPTGLQTTVVTSNTVGLACSAASDNIGVTGYAISRNGVLLATQSGLSFSDTGLTTETAYTYAVSARDARNNQSAQASLTVTTASIDTQAPTVPTNLAAPVKGSTSINLTWTASSDNVAVTGYRIFRNGSAVGTSASAAYSDGGLTASTQYTYTVSAYDAMNNESAQSTPLVVTTNATEMPNLLLTMNINVGFEEESTPGSGKPRGWMERGTNQFFRDTTVHYGGNAALKVNGPINSGTYSYCLDYNAAGINGMGLVAGKQYRLSGWVKNTTLTGPGSYYLLITGSPTIPQTQTNGQTTTSEWGQLTGVFTAAAGPASGGQLQLRFSMASGDTVWFDDVALREVIP